MEPQNLVYRPHLLSEEEIDILLNSDPKAADRMLLLYLNRLIDAHQQTHVTLTEHQQKEDALMEQLHNIGGVTAIMARAAFVDSLIKKAERRMEMMDVVIAAGWKWAIPAFLTFIVVAAWDEVVVRIASAIAHKPPTGGL